MHEPALEARALRKRFGKVVALDGLDLQVLPGDSVAILGDGAAGKSIAIRCLAGLTRPTSGTVRLGGEAIDSRAARAARGRLGVLAQEPGFYEWMTARELLEFATALLGLERTKAAERVAFSLERVGLADVADQRIAELSLSARSRLGLGQALVGEPDILLLDEPLGWLDAAGRSEILDVLRGLRGATAMFVATRDVELAEATCERTIVLDAGRVLAADATIGLLDRGAPREYVLQAAPGPGLALAGLAARLAHSSWVREVAAGDSTVRISVGDQARAERELLPAIAATGITVQALRRERPGVRVLVARLRGDEPPRIDAPLRASDR